MIHDADDITCRQLRLADVDHDGRMGSMSFTMDCDPDQRNYLTVKMDSNPSGAGCCAGQILLFDGDEQVGYSHQGKSDWLSLAGSTFTGHTFSGTGRQVEITKGDWVYVTMMLPYSMTEGNESVDIRIVNRDVFVPAKGENAAPLYRAYIHTDPVFDLPSDEANTINRDLGTPAGPGNDPSGYFEQKAESMTEYGQGEWSLSEIEAVNLARAYDRDWISTADPDAIFETVRNTIDRAVMDAALGDGPTDAGVGGWHGHGDLARAFEVLTRSDAFTDRGALAEDFPTYRDGEEVHPDDPISRKNAYLQFFENAYEWRSNSRGRRLVTNQSMLVSKGLIDIADALEILDPDRAPPASEVDQLVDEAFGITPMTAMFDKDGQEYFGYHKAPYVTMTKAGTNREMGYSAQYGWAPTRETFKAAIDASGDRQERLKSRLSSAVEAMGELRWEGNYALPGSERRTAVQASTLGNRGWGFWPGINKVHWQGYGTFAPAIASLLGEEDEVAKRWAERFLEDGYNSWAWNDNMGYGDTAVKRLDRMIWQKEGVDAVQGMTDSSYTLPLNRDRHVWADPENGLVTIHDGDHKLQLRLGHSNGSHISNIVKFDYQGPNSDRFGTTELTRKEFPQGPTYERPNDLREILGSHRGYITETEWYMPWKDSAEQVDQALRGEELSMAAKPNREYYPGTENGPSDMITRMAGFFYYYRETEVGPYRVGLNSTGLEDRGFGPAQQYTMDVPSGGAIDLETGEEITTDVVNVEAQEVRVLKLRDW